MPQTSVRRPISSRNPRIAEVRPSVAPLAAFTVRLKKPQGQTATVIGWQVNDYLHTRSWNGQSIVENWWKITAVGAHTADYETYTVVREAGTAAFFPPGSAVINYGPAGAGDVKITSDQANAPYLEVATHGSKPWLSAAADAQGRKPYVRLGQLAGVANLSVLFGLSAGADLWGLAVGDDLSPATLPVTAKYLAATNQGVLMNNVGLTAYHDGVKRAELLSNGNFRLGKNLSAGTKVPSLAVFTVGETYNAGTSEVFSDGDVLIGKNNAANILWDESAGQLYFRTSTDIAAYISTAGSFIVGYPGSPYSILDGSGVQLVIPDISIPETTPAAVRWLDDDGLGQIAYINGWIGVSDAGITSNVNLPGKVNRWQVFARNSADTQNTGQMEIAGDGVSYLTAGASGTHGLLTLSVLNSSGSQNVAIQMQASSGEMFLTGKIVPSGDIVMSSSKFIGLGSGAGRVVFTDAATDQVEIRNAALVVADGKTTLQGADGSGYSLELSRPNATAVRMLFGQNTVGSWQLYMPASAFKASFAAGQNELSIDFTNHRVGINDRLSPSYTLDVNGVINGDSLRVGAGNSLYQTWSGTLTTGTQVSLGDISGVLIVRETTANNVGVGLPLHGGNPVAITAGGFSWGTDAGSTFAIILSGGNCVIKNRYGANRGYVAVNIFI